MRLLKLAIVGSLVLTLTGCPVTDDYYLDGSGGMTQ